MAAGTAAPGPAAAPGRARVLLVEDDPDLAGLLAEVLTDEGHEVTAVGDGQRGLHLGLSGRHDALIVDRGLPAIEGVDLIRRLRRSGVGTPILVLTARGTVADRIEGLDAGAEDYLVKPFDLDELLARLRALLRRGAGESSAGADVIPLAGGRLVLPQRLVLRDGRAPGVSLSPRECALLEQLARRPQQVFSRDDLLDRVFDEADSPGIVDTYVHYLRRKLGRPIVVTVRGIGYRLGSM